MAEYILYLTVPGLIIRILPAGIGISISGAIRLVPVAARRLVPVRLISVAARISIALTGRGSVAAGIPVAPGLTWLISVAARLTGRGSVAARISIAARRSSRLTWLISVAARIPVAPGLTWLISVAARLTGRGSVAARISIALTGLISSCSPCGSLFVLTLI